MSRVINLTSSVSDIEALCLKHSLRISTVEPLMSGGSRVVMLDPQHADEVRILLKKNLITGDVKRSPAHLSRQPAPFARSR